MIIGGLVRHYTFPDNPPIVERDTLIVKWTSQGSIGQVRPAPVRVTMARIVSVKEVEYQDKYHKVDTAAILKDYYATRYYDDMAVDNDTLEIRIEEETYMNAIQNRVVGWRVHGYTREITNTVYRNGVYLGGGLNTSLHLTARGAYQRERSLYELGFNPWRREFEIAYLRSF